MWYQKVLAPVICCFVAARLQHHIAQRIENAGMHEKACKAQHKDDVFYIGTTEKKVGQRIEKHRNNDNTQFKEVPQHWS